MNWKELMPASWKKSHQKEKEHLDKQEEKYLAPRDVFQNLQQKFDEIFEDFFSDFGYPSLGNWEKTFYPKVDITEKENSLVIRADVPGIEEKDLEVSITKDSIILQGEKKYEHEEKDTNFYKKERSYGKFRRVIPLPVEVNDAQVEATYKNGVLTIVLPKSQEAKNIKKIPIKTSN